LVLIASSGDATYRISDNVLAAPDVVIRHDGVERFEITGGDGNDTYELCPTNKEITLNDTGGTDTLDFSSATSRIVVNLGKSAGEAQNIQGGGNVLALNGLFENVIGTPGHDSILGNHKNNMLIGGAGNDILIGQTGRDQLYGNEGDDGIYSGGGSDVSRGGPGNDRIWGGPGSDDVDGGSGDDSVRAGIHNDIVRGGDGNDELRGGNGNDVLMGGDGQDLVHGGMGRDLLIGNAGKDQVEGSVHDDILIGSSVTHEKNNAALMAIVAEWGQATSIDDRIHNLINGGGLNGTVKLDAASLRDDLTHDYLWGSYGPDWFITFPGDELAPGEPGRPDRVTQM
jgi:Ca2+-binding RTX toxin-like protein